MGHNSLSLFPNFSYSDIQCISVSIFLILSTMIRNNLIYIIFKIKTNMTLYAKPAYIILVDWFSFGLTLTFACCKTCR